MKNLPFRSYTINCDILTIQGVFKIFKKEVKLKRKKNKGRKILF